jgi:hypothetical protein
MRTHLIAGLALAVTVVAAPSAAVAQENYEIQVYPSKTALPRTTLFELHSNYTGSGSLTVPGRFGTNGAMHETLEITHGFNEIFELGFYVFSSTAAGGGYKFVATHIRPRIRAPESWGLPVGLSLSTEFGPTSKDFDSSEFGIELRPIIDQTLGNFYWSFNPNIEWSMKGPDAGRGIHGMNFAPSLKLQWTVHPMLGIGTEYYGSTGTVTRMAAASQQQHMVYPTLDFFFAPEWELNVGYGVQVAGNGDKNIFKVIFGRRFGF